MSLCRVVSVSCCVVSLLHNTCRHSPGTGPCANSSFFRVIHRQETERMFYHGYENYLDHAFPDDELRPLTCGPLMRDNKNSEHNDVLGNYSLTLIDSLSTLAILSSSPESGDRALRSFQDGVKEFVRLYGDGSRGPAGQGERARGFDIDSKVQVFETVIRGLGMSLWFRGNNAAQFLSKYARC